MTRITAALAVLAAALCAACSATQASRENQAPSSAGVSQTEIIPLQHVDAQSVADRIRSQHTGAKIVAQPSTNAIVVIGSSAQVDEVRRAVRRADKPG